MVHGSLLEGFIFILFYKAQARNFIYQCTSSMNHGSGISISFARSTALGFLQVNNLTATGSRLFKY